MISIQTVQEATNARRPKTLERFAFGREKLVTLYHFADIREPYPERLKLDPKRFGAGSYTQREREVASAPRVFFYLDPRQRESFFIGMPLYTTTVPLATIYDTTVDPDGYEQQVREKNNGVLAYGWYLNLIRKDWQGAYYRLDSGMHVVIWFKPIVVDLLSKDGKIPKKL